METTASTSPRAILADLESALGVTELVPIAQGGQKFVLRCLRSGRETAAKVMLAPPGGPELQRLLRKARREAAILAAVDSPRVARILGDVVELGFGGAGGVSYGVAWLEELLDGADLDSRLDTRWEADRVARLLVHLADALAAFHVRRIVHRDLSPVNVRESVTGAFTLMDPGLARRLDEEDESEPGGYGTPGFWSPEHTVYGAVGPAGDVFCLGILAYRALTGRLPVDPAGADYPDRLERCDFPSVASLRPDIPPLLGRIVDRCLRRRPEDRFADGRALLDELALTSEPFGRYFPAAQSRAERTLVPEPPTGLEALDYAGEEAGPVRIRGAFGIRSLSVNSIALNQEPFAVRLSPTEVSPASGVELRARTVELDGGRTTNSFELTVDLDRARIRVHGDPEGFHLPSLVGGRTVAAVSGTFSFISDEPHHQPAEPCLDFSVVDGRVTSLPTIAKPALLIFQGRPLLRRLAARGTLLLGGRLFGWVGSKAGSKRADRLVVYGAANCRVRYLPAPRTGFLRQVDRAGNTTPRAADAVDFIVRRESDGEHRVAAVYAGGGAGLFEGGYILRGPLELGGEIRVGDPVEVLTVDGIDCADIQSGCSIGPSAADAGSGDGRLPGYDDSLGVSPFLPGHRYARTLIGLTEDGRLALRVLDGAPQSRSFQGVSCAEAARLVAEDGMDPASVYHLDGGQSSKMAVNLDGGVRAYGSMHYLLWPKFEHQEFGWRGYDGRVLRSALCVEVG
jgi:serine/threonine protein kinase